MAGDRIRGAKIVGHQVDEIDDRLDLVHFGPGDEVGERSRRKSQEVAAVAAAAFGIERLPQVGHHRGEILVVLRTVHVVVAAQTGILPVDVDAVDVVPPHELYRAGW